MLVLQILFWIFIVVILYSYIGYTFILYLLVFLKNSGKSIQQSIPENELPDITLFVAAYNEKEYVAEKMQNSLSLNYPSHKLKMIWVTDGSDDGTPDILRTYDGVEVYHEPERRGKIAAMNRGMKFVTTPIVVFSDGNTTLGENSLLEIARMMADRKVGCVAGEKRIKSKDTDAAAGSGEGIYWKYESFTKKLEAQFNSVVGAAGELFAIRTELFEEVEPDTLLDDFIISLRIASKGYTIQYSPDAYAMEIASASISEELKRKIRIAAGGIQSIVRLKHLLNPFKNTLLSFQYVSHKVSRWVLAPVSFLLAYIINILLALNSAVTDFYAIVLFLHTLFYLIALVGWALRARKVRFKIIFVPYYIVVMNLAMFLGFARYLKGSQSVLWERAKRGQ